MDRQTAADLLEGKGVTVRYGVILEAGNCIYCGRHIDDGSDIFLCSDCRRKEEERKRLHEKLKDGEQND